jgi:hypothetical protein
MLWISISLFFCWLIFREFQSRWMTRAGYDGPDPTPVFKPYVALLIVLALGFAWPPFNYWRIERLLTEKATQLAEFHPAQVHCNTIFDTLFDRESMTIGHASPQTGKIVFQYPWCDTIMAYRAHPQRANREELTSLNVLTHESMHVRGEYNEAITECEAVQRNFRAAKSLGVPADVARKNALDYYEVIYRERGQIGGYQAPYFSDQCAPGKAMDEHLTDSTWAAP